MYINGIPVEVQGAYGEYYPAYITDISSADSLTITFAKDQNFLSTKVKVHPSVLRMTPNTRSHENSPPTDIIVGQEVEIPLENDTSQPVSWWPAVVQKSKGCFVVVNLSANLANCPQMNPDQQQSVSITNTGSVLFPLPKGISSVDVVESSQIRVRNWHPNLTPECIFKHILKVPSEYEKICQDPAIFEPLLEHCGSPCLVTVASKAVFKPQSDKQIGILIASTQHSVVQKAAFIQNSFISSLETRTNLIKQTQNLTKRLEVLRTNQALSAFTDEFNIPPHLTNRITERNLVKAQSIEGVTAVNYNTETHTFRITGSNEAAVKRAREILEFAIDSLLVPGVYVAKLTNLQDLVNRVGLGSLSIEPAGTDKPAFADFRFVGTRSAINDIKMALNFHIEGLRELDRLKGVEEPPLPPSPPSLEENPQPAQHQPPSKQQHYYPRKNNEITASENGHSFSYHAQHPRKHNNNNRRKKMDSSQPSSVASTANENGSVDLNGNQVAEENGHDEELSQNGQNGHRGGGGGGGRGHSRSNSKPEKMRGGSVANTRPRGAAVTVNGRNGGQA